MVQTTVAVERPNTNLSTAPSSFEELEKKFYSLEEEKQIESLMPLAKKLAEEPELAEQFGVFKWLTIGDYDREQRNAGRHPWPELEINGEKRIFSVPIIAGVVRWGDRDGEPQYSALSVMKDNWRSDPDAWLITEFDFETAETKRLETLGTTVDAANQANIVIKPRNYHNIPPLSRPSIDKTPMYQLERIAVKLDPTYHSVHAEYHEPYQDRREVMDIELLWEAMSREIGERVDDLFPESDDMETAPSTSAPKKLAAYTLQQVMKK